MQHESRRWPFTPLHITDDAQNYPKRAGFDLLTGQGIITNEHLQGLQTGICARLGNPTTIIEFSPDGQPVRTDSILPEHGFRPACACFRRLTCHRHCECNDNKHAALFFGLQGDDWVDMLKDRVATEIKASHSYRVSPYDIDVDNRGFLWYDCPILRYRELAFPIFSGMSLVGVLFVGQIAIRERIRDIHAIHQANLNDEQWIRRHFAGANPDLDRARAEFASALQDDKKRSVLLEPAYCGLIDKVLREVHKLRITLQEHVHSRRDYHARQKTGIAIGKLHNALVTGYDPLTEGIPGLWQRVTVELNALKKDFNLDLALLFGSKEETRFSSADLPVAASVGTAPFDLNHAHLRLPDNIESLSGASERDALLDSVRGVPKGALQDDHVTTIRCQLPFLGKGSVVFVFVHPHDRKRGESVFRDALQVFAEKVVSALASTLNAITEDHTRLSLRILAHETTQLISGIAQLTETYLSDPIGLQALDAKKLHDIYQDLRSFFILHDYLFQKAKSFAQYGWEDPTPHRTRMLVVGDLLHKWRDLYRVDIKNKSLVLKVPIADPFDPIRPPMVADKALIEQLVYNLVNNAVKYSHPGTRVILDYCLAQRDGTDMYIITATDYGVSVSEDDDPDFDPFRLYARGTKAPGTGVGLFLARRIALVHGGDLAFEEKLLSPLNVPLLVPYITLGMQEPVKLSTAQNELAVVRATGHYAEAVSSERGLGVGLHDPDTPGMLRQYIQRPTYRVTFTATIPVSEDQDGRPSTGR